MAKLQWNASITYLSLGDENAFFKWLETIPGVTRVEGVGTALIIHLRSSRISEAALREFTAIYKRYGGDMGELSQFRKTQTEPATRSSSSPHQS